MQQSLDDDMTPNEKLPKLSCNYNKRQRTDGSNGCQQEYDQDRYIGQKHT